MTQKYITINGKIRHYVAPVGVAQTDSIEIEYRCRGCGYHVCSCTTTISRVSSTRVYAKVLVDALMGSKEPKPLKPTHLRAHNCANRWKIVSSCSNANEVSEGVAEDLVTHQPLQWEYVYGEG